MDKSQVDQPLSPNSRRSFSFSSLRIKKRHNSNDEGVSMRRRGLRSFSSYRETSIQDRDLSQGFIDTGDQIKTGEQPRGNLISEVAEKKSSIPPGEDEVGRPGALKRFSAMWSSFRRGRKEKGKDPEPPEPLDPIEPQNVSRQHRYVSGQYFFEYLVVVSLKKTRDGSSYEPQITYQFPKRDTMARHQIEEEEKLLKAITLFSFPEGINWAPLTEYHSETFSFVLTGIDGSRKNGYCRRLLIFDEVEKRRQISMAMIYPFMQKLREAQFPAPGHTVEIKSFIPESGTEIISLTRPLDSWLEHVNFAILFDCLTDEEVLLVFAAAVLERRIIFVADELGTLSQVIHAVAALLYPFTWQHTFIPIIPEILIDVVMAPTPYLLGVQKRLLHLVCDQSDLMVDLSEKKDKTFIFSMGGESSILPPKLQTEILESLSKRQNASTVEELNRVVSESFLYFFVRTVGHYAPYVKYSHGAQGVFEKRSFYKAINSKTTRHFVKKFIQTQMFDLFIQEVEKQQPGPQQGIFYRKIIEYQEKKKREKKNKH
uniref:DENN/MADD domain containing 2Da n=1 Tax=Cynoglossus semilaevis TaxID=244447 RepID=A0A3P8UWG9_CYNSE